MLIVFKRLLLWIRPYFQKRNDGRRMYSTEELKKLRKAAEEIAEEAGRMAAGAFYVAHPQERPSGWTYAPDFAVEVCTKGGRPSDLQTTADVAVEDFIRSEVSRRYPSHGVLGEESHGEGGRPVLPEAGWTWVVDPIDGTTNFVHGLGAFFCVSIGVCWGQSPVAGAVCAPIAGETYSAAVGLGATRNGQRLKMRTTPTELASAVVACEFNARPEQYGNTAREVLALLSGGARGVRMVGSAALNLCNVASGRVDAYAQRGIQAWDMAAGVVVARETGCVVSDCAGREVDLCKGDIVAGATAGLHADIIRVLAPQ